MGLRLIALACLAGAAFAGPVLTNSRSQSEEECTKRANTKLEYVPGYDYIYSLEAFNKRTFPEDKVDTETIEGKVIIHGISHCKVSLRLKDVKIKQKLTHTQLEGLQKQLEIPLLIDYKDGKVSKTYFNHRDSTQSINTKKGIISALINTMSSFDLPREKTIEEDGFGKCETTYTVEKSGKEKIVTKVKDLKSCTNRHTLFVSAFSRNLPSSMLFNDDEFVCKQYIPDHLIRLSECVSNEKVKSPLKDKKTLVELSAKIRLELLKKEKASYSVDLEGPVSEESLLYSLEESRHGDSSEKNIEEYLRKLCKKSSYAVDFSIGSDYLRLLQYVKYLSYEKLEKIHLSLKNGQLCSSVRVLESFIDALPLAGTDAAVKLLAKLTLNREITGLKAKVWPLTLAFIPNPTTETVAAVIPLMRQEYSSSITLGVSEMVYKICKYENCKNIPAVAEVVSINEKLLNDPAATITQKENALRNFGNMGYHGNAHRSIVAFLRPNFKQTSLTLAAIESFRRIKEKRPVEIVHLYENKNVDHEVRIAAGSSVLERADEKQLKQILRIHEKETNPQVAAYIDSRIRNLNQTSSPWKQGQKRLLGKIEYPGNSSEFSWKNSRNIEISNYLPYLKTGVAVDTDIVMSDDTQLPISVKSILDAGLNDEHYNLGGFALRMKGVEKAFKKLLESTEGKKKIPDLREFLKNIDVQLSLRALDLDIFSISNAEFSGLSEVFKVANIMEKLASERRVDTSHNFVFLNSKLVVPSITGRSYSIELSGTSTIGLKAESKVDALDFPRNLDAKFHFNPRIHIEISAAIGPDYKVRTQFIAETDVEAKAVVKDGRLVASSIVLPSEDVVKLKLSTDIVEFGANLEEKSNFDKRQVKSYHLDKLEKALGLSAHLKIEHLKPFILKEFPFIAPVGGIEFSIKKSDPSLKSYVLHAEVPEKPSPHMEYKLTWDTPGSKVNRRFAIVLVAEQHKGHKKLSLELKSPFQSHTGTCSYTVRDEIIHAGLDIHDQTDLLLSLNFTNKIHRTKHGVSFDTVFKGILMDYEPIRLDGKVTVTKGRKHHLNFDYKVNMPKLRPLEMKGTIVKEGHFSQGSEWKLSSDISTNTPLGSFQVRKVLENRSKKFPILSINVGVDYKTKSATKKESIKFVTTMQRSSGKSSINAKFETTQSPKHNWYFSWDKLGEFGSRNLKNDINLKYGENPSRSYLHLKHTFKETSTGHSECSAILEIPDKGLHYELNSKHSIELGETPKLHFDVDLCYDKEKHITGIMDFNSESRNPLKANTRLEIQSTGGHIIYEDHIEETSKGHFEGDARLEYEEGKVVEIKYKYVKLDDTSIFHHSIETSLRTPLSPSTIESKASLQLNSESLKLTGEVGKYFVEAHAIRDRVAELILKSDVIEGSFRATKENLKHSLDFDLKLLRTLVPRHISASGVIDLGDEKQIELKITPNVDRYPGNKIELSSVVQRISGDRYTGKSKIQILDYAIFSLEESGDIPFYGTQKCTLDISVKNYSPIRIEHYHEISDNKIKSSLTYSKNKIEKAKAELEVIDKKDRYKRDISTKASLTSQDKLFEDMKLFATCQFSRSGRNIKTVVSFQKNSEVYKAELNSDLQHDGIEVKAEMNTPVPSYEKQVLGISHQNTDDGILSSISIETPRNKIISITSDIKKKHHGFTATWSFTTPLEGLEEGVVHISLDNHATKKKCEAYLHINEEKIIEYKESETRSSRETEIKAVLKVSDGQKVEFNFKDNKTVKIVRIDSLFIFGAFNLNLELSYEPSISTLFTYTSPRDDKDSIKVYLLAGNKLNNKKVVLYTEKAGQKQFYIGITLASSPKSVEFQGSLKTTRIPEISAVLKLEKSRGTYSVAANVVKGKSSLISLSFNVVSNPGEQKLFLKVEIHGILLFDVEISSDVSGDNSKRFRLKASGEFESFSVSVFKGRSKEDSATIEIRLCKGIQRSACYSLKAYQKRVPSSGSYRFYQKVDIDLEKSVPGSNVEKLGSFSALLAATGRDCRSKVAITLQERSVGYDLKLHGRKDENDYCTLEAHFRLPQCTSKLRVGVLHNSNRIHLDAEAIPDVEQPTRKLSLEVKKEINPKTKEVSGYFKVNHPQMSQPVMITVRLQEVGKIFVRCEVKVHYSSAVGKTLTLKIIPNLDDESSGIRSLDFKLYREDKSLDVSSRLRRESTDHLDKFEYEWRCFSRGTEKKGGATVILYDKKRGKPRSIKITYYSPSSDIALEGSAAQAPDDLSLSLHSKGQKLKEIRLKTTDSCISVETLQQGPLLKSTVCLVRLDEENKTLDLFKWNLFYQKNKFLDARISVEVNHPVLINFSLNYEKKEVHRVLREVAGLDPVKSITEVVDQLKKVIEDFKTNVLLPSIKDLWKNWQEIVEDIINKLKNLWNYHFDYLKQHSETFETVKGNVVSYIKSLLAYETIVNNIIYPFTRTVHCLVEKYIKIVTEHFSDVLNVLFETAKSHLKHCMKKYCVPGTFCHDIIITYEQHGLQEAQAVVQRKLSLVFWPWTENIASSIIEWIHSKVKLIKQEIESIFGKFLGDTIFSQLVSYIKKLEKTCREAIIKGLDNIINKINGLLGDNEDIKTVKALVYEAQIQVVEAWENREKLVGEAVQSVKGKVSENARKFAEAYFQALKYEPERGEIEFSVRQPLNDSEIEALKIEYSSFIEKVREFVRS
ncbi:apolipophorins [Trichonephila inaurata madagascariensis]|uniref:Apolipophorins n=1 Tax=Trichonephila inaurata madagascariensis TaxID=2747483 RepID=A0A8X6I2R2_9ARAC|nr:apolipophorins [Trichonephila inaurata madagascariensis]